MAETTPAPAQRPPPAARRPPPAGRATAECRAPSAGRRVPGAGAGHLVPKYKQMNNGKPINQRQQISISAV